MAQRVIGEGSYGCILYPPLPCKTDQSVLKIGRKKQPASTALVGKLMSNQNTYTTEWTISKVVAAIDPTSKYFLYPTLGCRVNPPPPSIKCDIKPNPDLYQLTMPYGGIDLKEWLIKNTDITPRAFARLMVPIFEGVIKMTAAGYCHQDIKTYNIIVNPDTDAFRLIDFSLTRPLTDIYKPGNFRTTRHTYFPYPPEYRIITYLIQGQYVSPAAAVEEGLKNILSKDRGQYFFKYHPKKQAFKNDIVGLMDWLHQDMSAIDQYADRVDVYSLGAIFIYAHKYLSHVSPLPPAYVALVASLTAADPRQRPTPTAALKALNQYLEE